MHLINKWEMTALTELLGFGPCKSSQFINFPPKHPKLLEGERILEWEGVSCLLQSTPNHILWFPCVWCCKGFIELARVGIFWYSVASGSYLNITHWPEPYSLTNYLLEPGTGCLSFLTLVQKQLTLEKLFNTVIFSVFFCEMAMSLPVQTTITIFLSSACVKEMLLWIWTPRNS